MIYVRSSVAKVIADYLFRFDVFGVLLQEKIHHELRELYVFQSTVAIKIIVEPHLRKYRLIPLKFSIELKLMVLSY